MSALQVMSARRVTSAPLLHAAVGAAVLALAIPTSVRADDTDEPRVLLGVDADVIFPLDSPHLDALWPGPTASVAAQFSVTKWLMPTLRLRGGLLFDQGQSAAYPDPGLGTLLHVMGGVRFRPRGIAHPEEVPRATCIWAEVDAGGGLWNGRWQPMFEATIGFDFEAGPIDLGPVVHFTHVLPTSAADGPDAFLLSIGLEVLVNDARGAPIPVNPG